jgi:leucyl-tRNA synthetase
MTMPRYGTAPHAASSSPNEEVLTDGSHEKCGNRVVRRNLKQWMLRIPYYAERLPQRT